MLVKSGSKLFIAGEYAVLKENAYALISFIEKFTYLDIEFSVEDIIISPIIDKDNLILNCLSYLRKKYVKENKYKMIFTSELFSKENIKYGLGSSSSIILCIIKGFLTIEKISFTKRKLFDIAVDFCIKNNIKGSYGDIACICFEEDILFISSNPKDRKYEILPINKKLKFSIDAIWSKKSSKTSILISKIDINHPNFISFFNTSNKLVKKLLKYSDIKIVTKLNNNLIFLDNKFKIGIFKNVNNYLKKHTHSKISGAGGGDFILKFKKIKNEDKLINLKV